MRIFVLLVLMAGLCVAAKGQYPGRVNKNTDTTPTLRATGVFEWTGDLNKPKAGRLIPLTVWDGEQYQPGGVYLAQPAPITLLTGTIYELEQAGNPKGLFSVNGAQNLQGSWIAVGSVKPEMIQAKAKPPMSKHPPQVVKDVDSDKPTLHRKDDTASAGSGTGNGSSDSDRPTLHRKDGSDSGSGSSSSGSSGSSSTSNSESSSTSSSDSDKPTLHRRDAGDSSSESGSSGDSSSTSSTSTGTSGGDSDRPTLHKKDSSDNAQNTPPVDPDRPTLHKHQDSAANAGGPVSYPSNPDPDRPKLRYGKPETPEGSVEPSKLEGLPADMNQMAAISDVKTRELHPFTYSWGDPADAAKAKAGMEELAQKEIAVGFTSPTTQSNVTKTATKTTATRRKAAAAPPAPQLPQLEDEKFSAFELSYNGGATLVLTAKATADNGEAKYVTVIAQPDFYGVPHPLFQQMTSDKALDVSPRMHLVDAADTDGDGRAELIFELRGKMGRAFGIYRVVPGRAYEAYNTGPLP